MRQTPVIRRRTLLGAATAAVGLCVLPAFSQSAKPLRLVVPYPPGGAVDATARLLSEKLPATLQGRAVIVDNRPGAGGNIAAALVARSDADGSSVLVTSNNHTINLALYQKPGYALEEFVPIAKNAKGFVRYYWLDTGDGEGASLSVYKDKAGADESVRLAADYVREHLSKLLTQKPEIIEGPIKAHD